ncbi:MAG: TRAP transporter large permease subunit [Moraxellaceae bacterium]|nr:TRAP transporter large permease subunit [Moraxellaceae bacterium]
MGLEWLDPGLLAPGLFVLLLIFLLTGYPVAFALGAAALVFALIGLETGAIKPELMQAVPERLFGIMRNDTLLAVPFFTFMGLVLERSGLAEELLETVGQLFGRLRGGLALAVVLVGGLLAATTGVVAASVMAMGLISLPVMLRHGYSPALASGVITASGTLAQIIPPSLVLIVLADTLSVPVGDMYRGALLPSLMLTVLFLGFIVMVSIFRPAMAPALPKEAVIRGAALWKRAAISLLPPVLLIFLVLGTIFMGLATPTEGGAMGAAGALVLAALKRRLTVPLLNEALEKTARLTCFVMFILIGSSLFALVFRALDGDLWVENLFAHVPGGVIGFLIIVNLLVFVLGFFIDFFEIAFIAVPLLAPVAHKLGIDPVWFGVMLAMNLQTSFLTPPFGFSLFYLRSVAPPEVKTSAIYKGVLPFIALQVLMVALLMVFPNLATVQKEEKLIWDTRAEFVESSGPAAEADEAIRIMEEIARDLYRETQQEGR